MQKESQFQSKLIRDLKEKMPGCIILKNDPNYIQGFPDLLILYNDRWAALECKREAKASRQPNQEYYVSKLNQMSFASFIDPENKEDVIHGIQSAFGIERSACIS